MGSEKPNRENGIEGYYKFPGSIWKTTLDEQFVDWMVGGPLEVAPEPTRPQSDSDPIPWTREDYERLSIPFPEKKSKKPKDSPDTKPKGGFRSFRFDTEEGPNDDE